MKKSFYMIGVVFLSFLLFFCDDETIGHSPLNYVGTTLGGCNTLSLKSLKVAESEKDTVLFSIRNDTLHVFAGLNYTCCAPFETKATLKGDSILMQIKDKCSNLSSCYCKCMCYYTFDFLFTGFGEGKYNYQIMLNNPRQSGPTVFREGIINIQK